MFSFKEVQYKNILNVKNLKIKKQTVTSIVGQSGSGKTTTFFNEQSQLIIGE